MAVVATYSFSGISQATYSIGGYAYRLKEAGGAYVKDSSGGQIWIIYT